jgi:hypothetical protein
MELKAQFICMLKLSFVLDWRVKFWIQLSVCCKVVTQSQNDPEQAGNFFKMQ